MIKEGYETITNCYSFKLKTKEFYEEVTGLEAISMNKELNYKYIDNNQLIEKD